MSIKLEAIEQFDSRSTPTVGVLATSGRFTGWALVPSGASKGKREALELRDGDPSRYLRQGVDNAIKSVNGEIAHAISNFAITDQAGIDKAMIALDGTDNKGRLGANAMLGASLAVACAAAEHEGLPLYRYLSRLYGNSEPLQLTTPMLNVINGGAHANNGLAFQEFMIVPSGIDDFSEKMRASVEIYKNLGQMLLDAGMAGGVGDEGGYSPSKFNAKSGRGRVEEVMDLLVEAIKKSGYKPGVDVSIAMDPAASEFYKEGLYHLDEGEDLTSEQMVDFCEFLADKYPLISVEDFMAEDDDAGWRLLTDRLGDKLRLVGDDLFVTNPTIFQEAIGNRIGNAILIKPNQIGTLTEVFEVIRMAKEAGYEVIISHRSGETEDTFIADLAVAVNAGMIKAGAPARGERTAKYNRLLRIARALAADQ